MGTCSSCRFWKKDDWRVKIQRGDGRDWGLCELLTVDDSDDMERPAEAACFSEGIGGDFVTTGEFGCTAHSPAKHASDEKEA